MALSWTDQLTGREVEAVERRDGGACVVRLSGGFRIHIESLWRLLSGGRLRLTSQDDGHLFGRRLAVQAVPELAAAIVGYRVALVEVVPGTGDLTVSFGDIALEAVSDSSGYEAWQVEGPKGMLAVGQGGGNVAVFG